MISCHVVVEKYGYVYEEIHQQDTVTTNTDSLFSARIRRWPETEDAMYSRLQNDASPCKKKLRRLHFLVELGGPWIINRGFHQPSSAYVITAIIKSCQIGYVTSYLQTRQSVHAQKYSQIILTACQLQIKTQPMRFLSDWLWRPEVWVRERDFRYKRTRHTVSFRTLNVAGDKKQC